MAAPHLELSINHLPRHCHGACPHPPRAATLASHCPHPPRAAVSAAAGTGSCDASFLASHRNCSFGHVRASPSRVACSFLTSHRNRSLVDVETASPIGVIIVARTQGGPPSVCLRHGQPAPPHHVGTRRYPPAPTGVRRHEGWDWAASATNSGGHRRRKKIDCCSLEEIGGREYSRMGCGGGLEVVSGFPDTIAAGWGNSANFPPKWACVPRWVSCWRQPNRIEGFSLLAQGHSYLITLRKWPTEKRKKEKCSLLIIIRRPLPILGSKLQFRLSWNENMLNVSKMPNIQWFNVQLHHAFKAGN
jgi:hypothetical protein